MGKDRRATGRQEVKLLAATALLFVGTIFLPSMNAQDAPKVDDRPSQTFYLVNTLQAEDGNQVVTGLRDIMGRHNDFYFVPSQNAIIARGTPEELVRIQKLVKELDRPRKSWRLNYTITEMDGGKRVGIQHTALVVLEGGRTTLKNGSKIPLATGSTDASSGRNQTQFTYIDVGLNIDASLDGLGNGARLRSKIEQSSAVEEKTIAGVTEPIIRQSVTEGSAILNPGKPITVGSLDIPGSTRHLEIEVVMEPVL